MPDALDGHFYEGASKSPALYWFSSGCFANTPSFRSAKKYVIIAGTMCYSCNNLVRLLSPAQVKRKIGLLFENLISNTLKIEEKKQWDSWDSAKMSRKHIISNIYTIRIWDTGTADMPKIGFKLFTYRK
jgi:hypothetical protein